MELSTFLNLAGFFLSLVSLFAAGWSKQWLFAALACALIMTTGATGIMEHHRNQRLRKIEVEIEGKLGINQWNAERIYGELLTPNKSLVQEALLRGVRRGVIGYKLKNCTGNDDGAPIVTYVYYLQQP